MWVMIVGVRVRVRVGAELNAYSCTLCRVHTLNGTACLCESTGSPTTVNISIMNSVRLALAVFLFPALLAVILWSRLIVKTHLLLRRRSSCSFFFCSFNHVNVPIVGLIKFFFFFFLNLFLPFCSCLMVFFSGWSSERSWIKAALRNHNQLLRRARWGRCCYVWSFFFHVQAIQMLWEGLSETAEVTETYWVLPPGLSSSE